MDKLIKAKDVAYDKIRDMKQQIQDIKEEIEKTTNSFFETEIASYN